MEKWRQTHPRQGYHTKRLPPSPAKILNLPSLPSRKCLVWLSDRRDSVGMRKRKAEKPVGVAAVSCPVTLLTALLWTPSAATTMSALWVVPSINVTVAASGSCSTVRMILHIHHLCSQFQQFSNAIQLWPGVLCLDLALPGLSEHCADRPCVPSTMVQYISPLSVDSLLDR